MHSDLKSEIATKHLQGYSELTLQAPIKRGFVESLDSRTYATRLKMVMDTLHTLRTTSREYSLIRPFSDSTDRIRTINSLRMWVQEPEQKLVLSVSFDRPWESYLRIIWRDVGTLLDVIFCNCVGYPISTESSFETYGRWITDSRTDTRFFYNNSNLTVDDLQYLTQVERLHRDGVPAGGDIDLATAQLTAADAEQTAIDTATASDFSAAETVRQGMQALSVLYRLADVYPPATPDGDILLRAAQQLLRELSQREIKELYAQGAPGGTRERFAAQLEWIESKPSTARSAVPTAVTSRAPVAPSPNVQGGIVKVHHSKLTHGCLMLVTVRDATGAAQFLERLRGEVTSAQVSTPPDDSVVYVNVAFSHDGLKRLGMTDAQLDDFPVEFREGMEARAGLLGDVRTNHPGNWALPLRNWPGVVSVNGVPARVQMAAVHIVVQLFTRSGDVGNDHEIVGNERHPLYPKVVGLMRDAQGVELLSVQALRRCLGEAATPGGARQVREHFGFVDGLSQPQVGQIPAKEKWSNVIALGDVLLGHENSNGDLPTVNDLLRDGSFLVVRKLRQDVDALNQSLSKAAEAANISADELKSKMLGRDLTTGAPLVNGKPLDNEYDYSDDLQASKCPFQAHIRRVNPRTPPKPSDPPDSRLPFGRPTVPRLMRRGMTYGPTVGDAPNAHDRGLMFMAYNASIGEQFEVLQRWISGGNSTGVFSGEADPLLGVPSPGDSRTFRFHDGTKVVRVALDDPTHPKPFVQLEWGAYLFAPSLSALDKLASIAKVQQWQPALEVEGEHIIEALLRFEQQATPQAAIDAWKEVLEDSSARKSRRAQAVWAAIRARHGGVLRTAYGVLVGDKQLVLGVFSDPQDLYSVKGYHERMCQSFGEIYLGLDRGQAYTDQATLANEIIQSIGTERAFDLARGFASKQLTDLIDAAKALAGKFGQPGWELTFDIKELSDPVLAQVNKEWFDIPDEVHVKTGGWTWNVDEPSCPGHFTAPSRYIFQPNPGSAATRYGQDHGKAVKKKMLAFVNESRRAGDKNIKGTISQPLFKALPGTADNNDLLARTLIGIMMGYLPTVEANLRATLNEWLEEKTLWDWQAALISKTSTPATFVQAKAVLMEPLMRTMQLRPLPELTWRVAAVPHRLGDVDIREGDKVVVGIVSAMQQSLIEASPADVCPVFGGDRSTASSHTHACPGYAAGMGVLLGVFTALFEAGPLRSTPAPLTLRLRGPVVVTPPATSRAADDRPVRDATPCAYAQTPG